MCKREKERAKGGESKREHTAREQAQLEYIFTDFL